MRFWKALGGVGILLWVVGFIISIVATLTSERGEPWFLAYLVATLILAVVLTIVIGLGYIAFSMIFDWD